MEQIYVFGIRSGSFVHWCPTGSSLGAFTAVKIDPGVISWLVWLVWAGVKANLSIESSCGANNQTVGLGLIQSSVSGSFLM